MAENPYQPPSSQPPKLDDSEFPESSYAVARAQKNMLYFLLINILLSVIVAIGVIPPELWILSTAIHFVVAIATAYFVFKLADSMNVAAAPAYALAMFIPCVSLFVLFVINQHATTELRKYGIKVGFMGAKLK